MSRDYRIVALLLLLSSSLPFLVNASPHPQRGGNRHFHGASTSSLVLPSTTTLLNNGNAVVNQGAGTQSTTVVNNGNTATTATNGPIITSSPSTGTGGGKRGLAYNDSSPSLDVFASSDITWVHDWSSSPGNAPSGFLFVPTLWSDESPHSDDWDSLAAGHQYLMSFNEPDIVSQANMQVGDAVTAYKTLMFPKRTSGVQIGAPSVSSGSGNNEAGIPMGTGWLGQFLQQCNDPNSCVA